MLDQAEIQRSEALPAAAPTSDAAGSPYLRLEIHLSPVAGPREVRAAAPPAGGSRRGRDRACWSGLSAPLVRRCLGKALIDVLCPFGEPRCQPAPTRGAPPPAPEVPCELATNCAYGVCFAGSSSSRPPFALYVPRSRHRPSIELTLYGPGCRFYPWLLQSLKRALGRGLGRARVRWRIDRVWQVPRDGRGERVCGSDLEGMPPALVADRLPLADGDHVVPQPVEVRLLSPTRLILDGRLLRGREPVPFEVLIGRILDRFQGLYGGRSSRVLKPGVRAALAAAAAQVPMVVDDTRWVEVYDYSARQGRELRLGGKVGRLIYGEGAARFLPILQAGEILHVGKNPTSGCGRIAVRGRMG